MKKHNYMAPLIKVLKPDPDLMNGNSMDLHYSVDNDNDIAAKSNNTFDEDDSSNSVWGNVW